MNDLIKKLSKCSNEKLNLLCAKALGWKKITKGILYYGQPPVILDPLNPRETIPNFSVDLNDMVEAVKTLPYEIEPYYLRDLKRFVMMKPEGVSEMDVHNASARDRCIALIYTYESHKTKNRHC